MHSLILTSGTSHTYSTPPNLPPFARHHAQRSLKRSNSSKSKMVSSHPNISPPPQPPLQTTKSSSPTNPATPPSNVPPARLLTAPDFGAAVLLVLGAGAVDDELEDVGVEELEERAAEAEDVDVDVVEVVEVVEVTIPPDVMVALVMIGGGVGEDVVSLVISFGTEAVDTNASVAAETAPLAAEDAPTAALEAATEAVDSALWTAAEAWVRGTMGMGRCVGTLAAAVLASTAALEATLTATVELATPPATFDATAPSSDAADWALAPA